MSALSIAILAASSSVALAGLAGAGWYLELLPLAFTLLAIATVATTYTEKPSDHRDMKRAPSRQPPLTGPVVRRMSGLRERRA